MSVEPVCCCGEDHSRSPSWPVVRQLVADRGETIAVSACGKIWDVPRVYIAMHGLVAIEIPRLADHFGWKEV